VTDTRGKTLMKRLRRVDAPGERPGVADPDAAASPTTDPSARLATTLIVNPYSSGMTARREREVVTLLREHTDLEVRRTERSGHAPELARAARDGGAELIVACGGDGTANEVLNGLDLTDGSAEDRPLFMMVPAGGTNVMCRSVGLPNHPVRATRQLVDAIRARRSRAINLGRMDERIFMFSAGIGFDGELVRRAETRRSGRRPGDLAHLAMVGGMFMHEKLRYTERLTVSIDDTGEELRGAFVMCGNTSPITYVGNLPFHILPDCTLEGGLDFVAPRRFDPVWLARATLTRMGRRAAGRSGETMPENHQLRHDISSFSVVCDEPLACQADGEYVGERTHISFGLMRDTVRMVY
jgi:diacylglycerol kinase family enzyme